jgi:hypothetical protein
MAIDENLKEKIKDPALFSSVCDILIGPSLHIDYRYDSSNKDG